MIDAVYAAAVDESRWSQALEQLTIYTNSQAATLWLLDGTNGAELPSFVYTNFEPKFIGEYLERMAQADPTVPLLLTHPDEPVVHDGLVLDARGRPSSVLRLARMTQRYTLSPGRSDDNRIG